MLVLIDNEFGLNTNTKFYSILPQTLPLFVNAICFMVICVVYSVNHYKRNMESSAIPSWQTLK